MFYPQQSRLLGDVNPCESKPLVSGRYIAKITRLGITIGDGVYGTPNRQRAIFQDEC